jgi:hypothetical protein
MNTIHIVCLPWEFPYCSSLSCNVKLPFVMAINSPTALNVYRNPSRVTKWGSAETLAVNRNLIYNS